MPTNIQLTDPILDNIQANILKGHGRDFAHHLFFQFTKGQALKAKKWIGSFAWTSAKNQLTATEQFKSGKITDGGPIFTLSLSSTGYDRLGLTDLKPGDTSFDKGMKSSAGLLGDDTALWDEAFGGPVDMMVLVADDDSKNAKTLAANIISQTAGFATLLANQRGNVLKMKGGSGIEHFGYADGISQPLYLAGDIASQPSTDQWNDETDTARLLVSDKEEPHHFGSYLVFRKLEQNVKAFKDAEGDNPPIPSNLPTVKAVDGKPNQELAGAMIVGRFENGTPTVQSSIELNPNPFSVTNDFDYSSDLSALKCPFHSHIRLMNPRNGDTIAGDVSAQRITRRGIPYDDVQRIPEDRITTISDDLLDGNQPKEGVGLLFMCYQSSIKTQFEIMQGFWANEGNIAGHVVDGQDSLIGRGTNPPKTLPKQWDQPAQSNPFSFHGFVKNKGGEYFFTPSIGFLRGLAIKTT
ncbi:MAG: Dyp-type peroxidase [Dyadobacter sp.]|uniref:Dyp-type peroxidase n=1 Tax=Dyadobacter sp. TaxID=1914288 RepID=UPI0032654538